MDALGSNTQIFTKNLLNGTEAQEVTVNIFGFLNEKELTQARLVCQAWKNLADDKSLWRPFLGQLKKGPYKINKNTDPRNFLILNNVITKEFKKFIADFKPEDDEGKRKKDRIKTVDSIELESPESRVLSFNRPDVPCPLYFRLSKETISALESASCLDRKAWNDAIEKVTKEIENFHFPYQFVLQNSTIFTESSITKFEQPNEELNQLIQLHKIHDVFKNKDERIVILAGEGKKMSLYDVNELLFEKNAINLYLVEELMDKIVDSLENTMGNDLTVDLLKNKITQRLNKPETEMKKYMSEVLPSMSKNIGFPGLCTLVKLIFPNIWQEGEMMDPEGLSG